MRALRPVRRPRSALATAPDPYRTVIVASLIQTEAKLDEDRPLIAAVVENRLRDDMPLQIDATLLYAAVGRDRPDHRRRLRARLAVQHLPRTGVCRPRRSRRSRRASLQAALHPGLGARTTYYVLIDTNGKHTFATTYAEHQANVADAAPTGL